MLRTPPAQFVYDAWYALLTPDRDFPRELRRLMNTAFGVIAARAHKCVNLRQMLLECAPACQRPPCVDYAYVQVVWSLGLPSRLQQRNTETQKTCKACCAKSPAAHTGK